MKANIVVYNDRRYDLMTGRMNRVKDYIIDKTDRSIKLRELRFEETSKSEFLLVERAIKTLKKLYNKQQLIKYGKE
jgi:hypothetical protein|tara:strand:- start:449 stop:676 length:228 start_codon:yes stop_codon:yes gene_type:complete